jgi:hypothetical protein
MSEAQPKGLYVKVGGYVVKEELSPDNYAVVQGGTTVYVRRSFADAVNYVAPTNEQGFQYVKPASPGQVLSFPYNVALYTRFIGTSGYMTGGTYYKGQKIVVKYQYVRPITEHAQALMSVVNLARALNSAGLPWTAVMVAYIDNRPKVLYVKSIYAWYQRYHTSAGVKAYPEVRFIFTRHLIHGLRKKTQYYFDLIVFYKVPQARATTARARQYVRAVNAQQAQPGKYVQETQAPPQPPQQVQVEIPRRGYVQAVADQYVQEDQVAELRAKERELLESAMQNNDLLTALDKLEKARKLREAMRHIRT